MIDKEKKNKIADILLDFYDEYHSNEINRPMIPSIYADKILNSLQEEPVREDEGKDKAYGIVDELSLPEKCKACIWSPHPSDVHDAGSHRTCHFVGTCNNFDRFRKREG